MSTEMSVKSSPTTSVADFYAGKSIFVTGGTGFIGKVYVQKILYSCPDVDKIYMLIRANSKEHAKQRVKELIENSLFENLQRERPENLKKIIPIVGNLTAPNLGISSEEEKLLIDKVSIVIHFAATIKFNEPLHVAYDYNIKGTRNVLDLAKQMINIQAFIHVSTLYCAAKADRVVIDETIYPSPYSENEMDDILKKYGKDKFPPSKILAGCPNTYTFTKSFAENLIMSHHGDLPTAIVRPTIVMASASEPYKGWIDQLHHHSFFLLAIAKGLIRAVYGSNSNIIDIIPVDYVANLMVLVPLKCKRSKEIDVYNNSSSGINPITYEQLYSAFAKDSIKNKSNDFPFPGAIPTRSKTIFKILSFLLQMIPAYFIDFWCYIRGIPSKQVDFQRKFIRWQDQNAHFLLGSWRAKSERVRDLLNTLNYQDRKQFPCDPTDISWERYLSNYSQSVRNFFKSQSKQ